MLNRGNRKREHLKSEENKSIYGEEIKEKSMKSKIESNIPGDPKKSIRVWSSISQQLFIKYKRNVLHRRNGKLT